ncbi:alpha-2-macroglobulin [uncultured Lutibacter sp.]|uniref:alpha-2-macroglobulin family protein n=1 Tax=uncultured Lutibacter sp. TaxID=437739 RepID=UPI0026144C94|nr:MG2 domain-containing protein [uncultured Lutibacter sp.]
MKKIALSIIALCLFSKNINSQNNEIEYGKLWNQVEKFELDNLPKSALAIVETIFEKAKKEGNTSQTTKALLYKSKFALTLEEEAQLKIINLFKDEITISKFPTKNILENILANLYWQYFQQTRWQFYNRTKTNEKVDETDFRTWDLQTLFNEIHVHFQSSLENGLVSQLTDLNEFSDILNLQKDSKIYRPTLYDFLSHNSLNFYKTNETSITKPSYAFEIDDVKLLDNFKVFSMVNIETKDSLSLQFNALKIYQKLVQFHQGTHNMNALIMVDLERLQFVKQNAPFENKDTIYLKSLINFKNELSQFEASTLIDFEIATVYYNEGNNYTTKTTPENQFKKAKAIEICNSAINSYPKSIGAEKCQALKQQILNKTLQLTAEKHIPINTHSKVLVSYKNIKKLYFNIYEISNSEKERFNKIYNDDEKTSFIKKLPLQKQFNSALKTENDYQKHSSEIIFPPLSNGNYLILASTSEGIDTNSTYATSTIQITDIALIETINNGLYTYQTVNRNNGKPLVGATINLKNSHTSKYNAPLNKTLKTDKFGQAHIHLSKSRNNVVATVNYKNDQATFGDYYLYEKRKKDALEDDESIEIKPFVFTDRSIYRPGQTVYFKGIFLKKTDDKTELLTNEFVEITLEDPNGQLVKKLDLKLNEYGSVSGEFILPNNGLTGEYTINTDESYEHDSDFYDTTDFDFDYNYDATIQVEEYKRPKFETSFNPITETFKLNDSITVEGSANAFAGSKISNGKVVYRVVRTAQYPKWYAWYARNMYQSQQLEITNGETETDADGNYIIKFIAVPDLKIAAKNLPTFNYQITADVTDINGETRSTSTNVKVGYHTLEASISMDSKIDKNEVNKISISTTNLNDEFVPTAGTLKIFKLKAPLKPLRKRPWESPDYQLINEQYFRSLFPHEPYTNNETDENNWEKGALVFETNFDTNNSKEIELNTNKNWISGNYIVIVDCKDKFNQVVHDENRFSIFSLKEHEVADAKLFFINKNKTNYQPHELVELQLGSASKNATITVSVEKNHNIISTHLVHLNNETKTLKIPVEKEDVGGFAINYHFVNYNSFENGQLTIDVPQIENNITIETLTFRDKLQPGENQTWSFKVVNDKNNKVAAELLASMYDASLDEFLTHSWNFNPISYSSYYSSTYTNARNSFGTLNFRVQNIGNSYFNFPNQQFDTFNWFGFSFNNNSNIRIRGMSSIKMSQRKIDSDIEEEVMQDVPFAIMENDNSLEEVVVTGIATSNEPEKPLIENNLNFSSVKIRKNFNETAFFFPHLTTDKDGNVSFNFTVPEALTRWKLQLLAHTKDATKATKTLTTVTQKDLMVLPNPPRFLREGDKIVFSSKISNLSDKFLNGTAILELTDAISGKDINNLLGNAIKIKPFEIDAKGNTNVSWELSIPDGIQAIQYKVIAKAGEFSDGEQNVLPVLSNRMLVTETLPMWVRSNQTKTFSLDKLKNTTSKTLKNHKLTLEVTSNPAWYAVQSLPYLMEYPYECSEQTFSRLYANSLASHILESNPRIKEVFNQWQNSDALISNLEKNEDLKSIILQETPWVRDAQSETEQKKRIALLFDLNKLSNEQQIAINQLKEMQFNNGGFPWFKGNNYPNRYITQHIATGFGHLQKLGLTFNKVEKSDKSVENIISKAVNFLDEEVLDDYNKLLKQAKKIRDLAKTKEQGIKAEKAYLEKNNISYTQLHYLYMRSFYSAIELPKNIEPAYNYYKNQGATYWNDFNLYGKGLNALVQHRSGNNKTTSKILNSLKENSITSDELGMYWKENTASWHWNQAPIETQALLIEVFSEIENDISTVDELKVWLLKNKQTNRWGTTKSTTEAVYALLLQGSDWLSVNESVEVIVGNQKIEPSKLENVKVEAGTGYFKTSWNGSEITPSMGNVTISKKDNGIAWGGLYWQYFEDLDKITSAETPLKLNKKIFLKTNSNTGKLLTEINEETNLKLGDLITVRIELKVDRSMEFVHMKDMRASGLEPINVLSQYKWQDGLGYYESTKDASTNFFFDNLPKGVFVFEYDLRVNNAGNFSNGITTIQSMYAPEFSSHSEGVRIEITN